MVPLYIVQCRSRKREENRQRQLRQCILAYISLQLPLQLNLVHVTVKPGSGAEVLVHEGLQSSFPVNQVLQLRGKQCGIARRTGEGMLRGLCL